MTSGGRPAGSQDDESRGRRPLSSRLHALLSRTPMHAGDRIPGWVVRSQEILVHWVAPDRRLLLAVSIIIVAVAAFVALSSMRLLFHVLETLDFVALAILLLVNWLGNGGALVPIPGARLLGLLMIFSQAALLPSWEVLLVGGAAMSLGLLSYYTLGARTHEAYARGDVEGAARLARDAGLMSEPEGEGGAPAEVDAARPADDDPARDAEPAPDAGASGTGLRGRFGSSLGRAARRARPVLDRHGTWGMFWLCLTPTPMGTAAAFVGGVVGLGFSRFLVAALAAKYLLTGIVVLAAFVFSSQAQAVELPFGL